MNRTSLVRETPSHSSAALLSIALGCAEPMAEKMLDTAGGSLRDLSRQAPGQLEQRSKAPSLVVNRLFAVLELCKRYQSDAVDTKAPLRSPRDVAATMAPVLQDLPVEEFHVLILNAQHRLERDVTITRGLLNSSLVHPREVFREAIAERAAAVVLVHNHPSGDPTASAEDRAVTDQLVAAGKLLDIPVHDHVIIGRGRYLSFCEAGYL